MDFVAATFNLRTETGRDGENAWPERADRAAEMIRRTGALIVGTQEGSHRMLTDLAARLPEYAWIGQGRRGGTDDEHCAILYRVEGAAAEDAGHFWLSETPEEPGSQSWDSSLPRMCTWARFRLHAVGGHRFTVYNTHLDHRGAEARDRGIRLICARLRARRAQDGVPALLMGDLNAEQGSDVVGYLHAEETGLTDAFAALRGGGAEVGATFHGFRGEDGGSPIDYIFGTPDVTFDATEVRRDQVGGGYPSDHYPVVTTVHLGPAGAASGTQP